MGRNRQKRVGDTNTQRMRDREWEKQTIESRRDKHTENEG